MKKLLLTIELLCEEAERFSLIESAQNEPLLYGVTDGKAVGTYLEQKFRNHLQQQYEFTLGNSASGIDFPELLVDMKTTSIKQPQSSCPYKSARQKIYGLGYSLIVFVYDKIDAPHEQTARLTIHHTIFVQAHRTGDFQMTRGLRNILANDGNRDDVAAFLLEKNLPVDEIGAGILADEILHHPPEQGFLTISAALQWRLQYGRVIAQANQQEGIRAVFRAGL
ncbi:MAG TPA: restriction endonuclease [Blastocatellia bacterium]|nr:restriction endonuclease [Blastocatellia bacterium]